MTYKIEFERDKCLGCGACNTCDNWKMDDDGKASPVKTKLDEIGCNKEASDMCPVQIIKIIFIDQFIKKIVWIIIKKTE